MNSILMSQSMSMELPLETPTGNLLSCLDEATQAKVLEQRFIKYPLAEGKTSQAKQAQIYLQQRSYYDITLGDFIVHTLLGRGSYKNSIGKPLGFIHANDGYRRIKIYGRSWLAHHLVWIWFTGNTPSHKNQIDHINKNKADNNLNNLRMVTNSINCRNRKLSSSNTSGYAGVVFHKATSRWYARINLINGKRIDIDSYYDKELAVKARQEFLQEHPELLYK
jgi:hypothetical protein